jgi:hypothetical protein
MLFRGVRWSKVFHWLWPFLLIGACRVSSCSGSSAKEAYRQAKESEAAKDYAQAAVFYRDACNGGVAWACFSLGTFLREGSGVLKDAASAAVAYGQACDGGVQKGCAGLGLMYDEGLGVSRVNPEQRNCTVRRVQTVWIGPASISVLTIITAPA